METIAKPAKQTKAQEFASRVSEHDKKLQEAAVKQATGRISVKDLEVVIEQSPRWLGLS